MLDNEKLHKDRLKDDKYYSEQNTNLYKVLKKSTFKGTSRVKVKKYEDTKGGAMAYVYLKELYDQEGDYGNYAQENIGKLMQLKLEYNSNGGMEKYTSAFEDFCGNLKIRGTTE